MSRLVITAGDKRVELAGESVEHVHVTAMRFRDGEETEKAFVIVLVKVRGGQGSYLAVPVEGLVREVEWLGVTPEAPPDWFRDLKVRDESGSPTAPGGASLQS